MNKIQLLATMTRDCEVKYSQGGSAIGNFGVAYNDTWKDQSGQKKEKALFFDVSVFGKQAEIISQYFHKGSRILIEGSLDFQAWTAQDGSKKSKVGIKLTGFSFIDKKSDTQPQQDRGYSNPNPQYNAPQTLTQPQGGAIPEINIDEDAIPFAPIDWRL